MSEAQVPAQVSASSYRSPVEVALSLESELEAYDREKDRKSLLNAVKEQFLLTRLVAASQARVSERLCKQVSVSLPYRGDSHDDQYDDYTGVAGSTAR